MSSWIPSYGIGTGLRILQAGEESDVIISLSKGARYAKRNIHDLRLRGGRYYSMNHGHCRADMKADVYQTEVFVVPSDFSQWAGIRVLFLFILLCCSLFCAFAAKSYSAVHAKSDSNGITVEFDLPELNVSTIEHHGFRYRSVRYEGSGFTNEAGNPQLPVSRVMLGVPPNASFHVEVTHATHQTRRISRISPVPHRVRQTSSEGMEIFVDEWREDGAVYQSEDAHYPRSLAQISYDGYIRSQRVILLELHPVQYQPRTRSLRIHPRLVVRVHIDYDPTRPRGSRAPGGSGSLTNRSISSIRSVEPIVFERMFQRQLSNYDEARRWRVPREQQIAFAPATQQPTVDGRYKILIDNTGIYRLTSEDLLQGWNIDLRDVDPRYLHLRRYRAEHGNEGQEIPIYIRGEADGRFDRGDYLEFFGLDAESKYTHWNVYWLTVERTRGKRVTEINAHPGDPRAKTVPVFRSKVVFEEDHLTSNLEHVSPDDVSPGNKHGWFESLDFWYWTGIKNAGDFNDDNLEFPLYDLTQSFVQPRIRVLLQGGAPTKHEILVSVNGIRIDNATWSDQNVATVERTLRAWDNLRDITKNERNELTITRVDTTTEDDTTRYPYHAYINSFEVEYTRLLKAVNDYLAFSSPTSTEPYAVRKHRTLEYTVQSFLSPDVEVFEYDGEVLTAKLQIPKIDRVPLNRADRDRLRLIFRESSHVGEAHEQTIPLGDIPHLAYNATFHAPDSHDAKFLAVSSAGVRRPVRVEYVPPTDILSPSNGADYLIISHPVFFEASHRLAEWRSTSKGGGHRAKVVDVNQIYNTFSNGMVDPNAIKAFLTYAYNYWAPPALSFLVIMGDGTFDYRGTDEEIYPDPPELLGYIPTHYIWTSSFGRTSIDHWYATVSGIDELADFYVGRLSAETPESANEIVEKIVNYEGDRPNGSWRRQIISVADDEINNSGDFIFKKSLTEVAQSHTLLGYETTRIFLEDIIKEVNANPEAYGSKLPKHVAKEMIINTMGKGAVIAQYAGHGGRIVWAHEAIFDNASIDRVDQTEHLPFMLVLSCYNGYFDAPGEPSMAEKLLRKERGGIIGMLSATRLTYGSGNDTLNRIIFDNLFKRNVRGLGELSFDSKVELLIRDGIGQIDVMMEYTLFGDPAINLAIADYEMQPEVKTKTVAPGETLRIAPGEIFEVEYDPGRKQKQFTPLSDFNGTLQVKAVFPGTHKTVEREEGAVEAYSGDVIVTRDTRVSNGKFPAISLPVPKGISAGNAHVEYYAENTSHIAVGGDSFTVLVPKILDIQPEVVSDTTFHISVQVSDELESQGIKEIHLDWRNPLTREWTQVTMDRAPSRGKGWYTTPKPLSLSPNGAPIRYEIIVTDIDNRTTASDTLEFRPFVFPNIRAVRTQTFSDGLIYYGYSYEANAWTLNVDIEQVEDLELKESVEVAFFEGNPDLNEDYVVDHNAKLIDRVLIRPNSWQRRNPLEPHKTSINGNGQEPPLAFKETPLNTNWIATATIQHELEIGVHEIFTWVDPVFDSDVDTSETKSIQGKIREGNETDNINTRRISVQGTVVGRADRRIFSQDGIIDFRVPARNIPQPAVLTITPLSSRERPASAQQSNLKPIGLPNGVDTVAYDTALESTPSGDIQLNAPIIAELRFDLEALRTTVRGELGLTDIFNLELDQITAINEGAEQQAKEIGMYLWLEALDKWVRLNSDLVTASNASMELQRALANVSESNRGNGEINGVETAPTGAKVGKWVLSFTSPNTYRLLISENEGPLEIINPNRNLEQFVETPGRPSLGYENDLKIGVSPGDSEFQFGDVLTFEIAFIANADSGPPSLYASSFKERNNGPGAIQYIRLDPNSSIPSDRWAILFTDSNHFQVEGEKTGILSQNGQPITGKIGEEFAFPEFGLTLKILAGEEAFEPGDSFRFETKVVGRVRAEVPILGKLALMRSDDTIPPDLQLTVGKQNFIDGDPVSKEPLIQATLTDDSGIDYITRTISLEINQDNREFKPIQQTQYRLSHRPGSNQVVLNYQSPELEPGTYQVRLTASDLEGNQSEEEIEFRVHKILQLLKAMNFENPFRHETTITCELTSAADYVTMKIYSVSGRLVREFEEPAPAGFMMVRWDGLDEDGEEVANGVYYCKIRVKMSGEKDLTEYIRMMKLK